MMGKGTRFVILAIVVGVAFRLFYDWLSGGGQKPTGLDALAAVAGFAVAGLATALLAWKQGKEKADE